MARFFNVYIANAYLGIMVVPVPPVPSVIFSLHLNLMVWSGGVRGVAID